MLYKFKARLQRLCSFCLHPLRRQEGVWYSQLEEERPLEENRGPPVPPPTPGPTVRPTAQHMSEALMDLTAWLISLLSRAASH